MNSKEFLEAIKKIKKSMYDFGLQLESEKQKKEGLLAESRKQLSELMQYTSETLVAFEEHQVKINKLKETFNELKSQVDEVQIESKEGASEQQNDFGEIELEITASSEVSAGMLTLKDNEIRSARKSTQEAIEKLEKDVSTIASTCEKIASELTALGLLEVEDTDIDLYQDLGITDFPDESLHFNYTADTVGQVSKYYRNLLVKNAVRPEVLINLYANQRDPKRVLEWIVGLVTFNDSNDPCLQQLASILGRVKECEQIKFLDASLTSAMNDYVATGAVKELVNKLLPANNTFTATDNQVALKFLTAHLPEINATSLKSSSAQFKPLYDAVDALARTADKRAQDLAGHLTREISHFAGLVNPNDESREQFAAKCYAYIQCEQDHFKQHRNPWFDALRDTMIKFLSKLLPKSLFEGDRSPFFGKTTREKAAKTIGAALVEVIKPPQQ